IKVHRTISPLTTIKTHKQKKRKDDRNHLSSLLLYFKFFIHLCFSYTVSSRPKGRTSRNLTNLRQLDLSHVNLSSEMPQMMISNLTSLRSIRLHGCNLFGRFPRLSPTIRSIDLSVNPHLESSLPEFNGSNSLVYLDVTDTSLSGSIPEYSISNLKHLKVLSFSDCKFTGKIPSSIGNLSHLNILDFGYNNLAGEIPTALFNLTKLSSLSLASNHFTGTLPHNINSLSNLNIFNAASNSFFGTSLQQLTLSHINTTIARIDLNAVLSLPLKSLSILDLSGSHVSVENMSSSVSTLSSQLIYLFLSGCGITVFPEFISSLQYISMIDLSNNSIKGQVPAWLWRLPELHYAELSYNAINGFKEFPKDVSRTMMSSLFLNKNNLSRENPRAICDMASLSVVDLSNNNFSGSVPQCLSNLIKRGHSMLVTTNWRGNFQDLCRVALVLNMEHNRINDTFPFWLGSLPELHLPVLRSNEFHGSLQYHPNVASHTMTSREPYRHTSSCTDWRIELNYTKIRAILTLIDLSGNRLQGQVKALKVLNLSSNGFVGNIPSSLANLVQLESLDLSRNKLSGHIPRDLADLTSL
ncbi:hypothetical protein HID58_094544, partial [Brassica napus]